MRQVASGTGYARGMKGLHEAYEARHGAASSLTIARQGAFMSDPHSDPFFSRALQTGRHSAHPTTRHTSPG